MMPDVVDKISAMIGKKKEEKKAAKEAKSRGASPDDVTPDGSKI
jgi:hypothetical protein